MSVLPEPRRGPRSRVNDPRGRPTLGKRQSARGVASRGDFPEQGRAASPWRISAQRGGASGPVPAAGLLCAPVPAPLQRWGSQCLLLSRPRPARETRESLGSHPESVSCLVWDVLLLNRLGASLTPHCPPPSPPAGLLPSTCPVGLQPLCGFSSGRMGVMGMRRMGV